jgi:hypothetical protein
MRLVPAAAVGGVLVFSVIQSSHQQILGTPVGYGYGYGPSPAPILDTVSPTNGPPAGGQTVTLTGTNFATTVTVKFGSTVATQVGAHTSSTITVTSPAGGAGITDVTVINTGGGSWTKTHAYAYLHGVYTLDAFGGVHAAGTSPNKATGPYWTSKLARSMALLPSGNGGFVLDAFGGVTPFTVTGGPAVVQPSSFAYFAGFDIARDIVLTSTSTAAGSSGYTLDGYGGIHPFGGAPAIAPGASYWKGFDIARRIVLLADGSGGYVLDGWGGIHPFATGSNTMPATPTVYSYWNGFNIARDLQLMPGSTGVSASGFTLDGYGGLHPWKTTSATLPSVPAERPYWGFDIGRAFRFAPSSTASNPQGWILDGYGGISEVNDSPLLQPFSYWAGQDIAKQLVLN